MPGLIAAANATAPSGGAKLAEYADLAIYDDALPSPGSPFRTLEYCHYLTFFERSALVSLEGWHHGYAHRGLGDLAASLPLPEATQRRSHGRDALDTVVPRLAYVTFLANAANLLAHFEQRRIPFILQLYPGGAFEPHVADSDDALRRIAGSPLCRHIIATQRLTQDYLLGPIGCDPAKVTLIYGGVFDSRVGFDFARDKKQLGRDKDTIDLCFVAHRYGNDMAQKGYDHFVEVARRLSPGDARLRFHVVGDYRPDDLPLGDAAPRFTFHGMQPSAFFAAFYPRMDVILSGNRPLAGAAGPFDGFPTGACMEAGFRGVLNAVADPLDLNVAFEDGRDILIIDRDVERTAGRLAALFADPARLYALAEANWRSFRRVFDVDSQLWQRTRIIVSELMREEQLVVRPAPAAFGQNYPELRVATANWKDAERRHDNLLAAYLTLAEGYEALLAERAERLARPEAEADAKPPAPVQPPSLIMRLRRRTRLRSRARAALAQLRGAPE